MITITQVYQVIAIFIGLIGSGCLFTPYFRQKGMAILNATSGMQPIAYSKKEVENMVQQNIINLLGWSCFFISFLLQAVGIIIKLPEQNISFSIGLYVLIGVLCFLISLYFLYRWLYSYKLKEVHRLGLLEMCKTLIQGTVTDEYVTAVISWAEDLLEYKRKNGEPDEIYIKRICQSLNYNIPADTSFGDVKGTRLLTEK